MTRDDIAAAIYDAMTFADVGCGPWCNDQRGRCISIREHATEVAADAILPFLPDETADYLRQGDYVETLRRMLRIQHGKLVEARATFARVEAAIADELANLADDGARSSHSVVRRIEAALEGTE